MGKRSQSKQRWLTTSQRKTRGEARSGATIMVMLSKAQKRAVAEAQARQVALAADKIHHARD